MKFGSWPGPDHANMVIGQICSGLEQQGHSVEGVSLVRPRRNLLRFDALLVHWPEAVLWSGGPRYWRMARAISFLLTLAWLRLSTRRVIWIAHNVRAHDMRGVWRVAWFIFVRLFVCLVDGWVTLSPSTRELFVKEHPPLRRRPWGYAWHPAYPVWRHDDRQGARRKLGLPEKGRIILLGGNLRPYKGIDRLIEVFRAVPEEHARLLIVGPIWDKPLAAALERQAGGDARIDLRFGHVPLRDFEHYLLAADLFVVPFVDVTHSGSLVHALSAGLPVLTTSSPFTRDLAQLLGERWVRLLAGDLTVADLMTGAAGAGEMPDLTALSAAKFGTVLSELSAVLSKGARPIELAGNEQDPCGRTRAES